MSAPVSAPDPLSVPLQNLHTFGLQATARALRPLACQADLLAFTNQAKAGEPLLLLGEGSNTVFVQASYPMTVWAMRWLGKQWLGCDGTYHRLRVNAGENWHNLVEWTLLNGWPGLENLALIPGSVGASPVQNIGAYGVELDSRVAAVHVWDVRRACHVVFSKDHCEFAYRDSIFKHVDPNKYVITAVDFALPVQWQAELGYGDVAQRVQELGSVSPLNVMKAVCDIRSTKLPDPLVLGNSGSFFKNPVVAATTAQAMLAKYPNMVHYPMHDGQVKLAAGWLIDQTGLKGHRIGQVGVYSRQALILVNHGGGKAEDLRHLIDHIRQAVQSTFGVLLEPEPNLI
ncbi:MAG TPA: UDP-N-acetylmuramate dehydrogenase [Limnobacter sp.]|nr:UDP-N-acetylmuramate dehydrogenase [Limnobacter sp.]